MFVFQTVIEFTVAVLLIIGLFKEEKVVRFEDRIIASLRKKLHAKRTAPTYRSSNPCDRKNCA